MSRIRSVHPGLFTDEAFMEASAHARIVMIGLWCEADDQGVFEWKPLRLKARLLPADNVDLAEILNELAGLGVVRSFEHEGRHFGAIRNFRKYQRPQRPTAQHPLPDEIASYVGLSASIHGALHEPSASPHGKPPQMEDGGGKKDREEEPPHPEKPETDTGAAASRSARAGRTYFFEAGVIRLNEPDFLKWEAAFPNVSLRAELTGLAGWAGDQPNWFFAVPGALAKRDREARLAVERIKAEAIASANAPAPRKPAYFGP